MFGNLICSYFGKCCRSSPFGSAPHYVEIYRQINAIIPFEFFVASHLNHEHVVLFDRTSFTRVINELNE